MSVSIGELSLG